MKYLSGAAFAAIFALSACGGGDTPCGGGDTPDAANETDVEAAEEECEGPNCNTGGNGRPIEEIGDP